MLIIRARFVGMGDTLEEAAYDLGSGPLATFRQVTLPRLMPAIVAAALLSFTFSFDDYVVPAFTNGTTNTWPIVLYSAVRFGLTPAVNALATIMLTHHRAGGDRHRDRAAPQPGAGHARPGAGARAWTSPSGSADRPYSTDGLVTPALCQRNVAPGYRQSAPARARAGQRSGMPRSRLGRSMPPSTSMILPVM